jgi:pyridoxal phosphate enzyme (YggS family)
VTAASGIEGRIAGVHRRIGEAAGRSGRDPAAITLIAVSKTWPASAVAQAFAAGITDVGENRVQEALAKMSEFGGGSGPRWHLIGHLQTNKVRAVAGQFAILHAIDSERLLRAVAAASALPQRVMIEVNVSGEATKFGVPPAGLAELVAIAAQLPSIRLEGLMTVAPLAADPEQSRPFFRALRELAERHGLPSLSMGMSGDFEIAVEEGATHVRVGRAIFGERA